MFGAGYPAKPIIEIKQKIATRSYSSGDDNRAARHDEELDSA